jgi:hypothetical protein
MFGLYWGVLTWAWNYSRLREEDNKNGSPLLSQSQTIFAIYPLKDFFGDSAGLDVVVAEEMLL